MRFGYVDLCRGRDQDAAGGASAMVMKSCFRSIVNQRGALRMTISTS